MSILRKSCTLALSVLVTVLIFSGTNTAHASDLSAPYDDDFGHYHSIIKKGPSIPNLDDNYVPQGLAYYPAKDWLLISYYSELGDSIIAVIDKSTGAHVKNMYLTDEKPEGVLHHTGHVGGLAVSGNYLWVASTLRQSTDSSYNMLRFKLSDVSTVGPSDYLPLDKGFNLLASSYAYYADGALWVGSFENSVMYRYDLDSSEEPSLLPSSIPTPKDVQGVAVTQNYYIYSQSYGRDNPGYLRIYDRADNLHDSMTIPNMSEGLAVIGKYLYINFESGANIYSDSSYIKKTLSYGKLGFIIPDYWKKIYGAEANYAPYEGYMRTWTESDDSDDLRVELEGIKYSAAAVDSNNSSHYFPSVSFDGEDYLDNDSWDYTYTNFPDPEFDNFDEDANANGDGIDNDDIVQVTAMIMIEAEKSYRFGCSFEPQNTSQSGEIRFYSSLSQYNGTNMIPKESDYLGKVPWKYGLSK